MKRSSALGVGLMVSSLSLAAGCAKREEGLTAQAPTPVSPAQVTAATQQLPEPDRSFVRQAVGANFAAVRMGQLAMERGTSDKVRDIGREMVDSHTRLNNELREAAAKQGVELPLGAMTPEQQAMYDQLSKLSGPAFDQAYLDGIRTIQEQTVGSFQNEAMNGQMPGLSRFANDALPSLNERVRLVRRAMGQL